MRIDKITTPPTEKYLNIKISKNFAFPFVFFFPRNPYISKKRSTNRISIRLRSNANSLDPKIAKKEKTLQERRVFEGGRKLRLAGHVAVVDPRVGTTDKEIGGRGREAWYAREIARRGNVVTARSGAA